MVSNPSYRVNVSDFSVVGGSEHFVVTVHEQQSDGSWKLQLEMNGLATKSNGEVSEIGSQISGHKIKAYVTGGLQENSFSIDSLSSLLGISKEAKIFNPLIKKDEKIYNINQVEAFRQGGYFYDNTDQFTDTKKLTGNTVFSGTKNEALNFVSGMLRAGNAINDADYSYEFPSITNIFYHTQNSNRNGVYAD